MAPLAPIMGISEVLVHEGMRIGGNTTAKKVEYVKLNLSILSSTLFTNIQGLSILLAVCRIPSCRNMNVNRVI